MANPSVPVNPFPINHPSHQEWELVAASCIEAEYRNRLMLSKRLKENPQDVQAVLDFHCGNYDIFAQQIVDETTDLASTDRLAEGLEELVDQLMREPITGIDEVTRWAGRPPGELKSDLKARLVERKMHWRSILAGYARQRAVKEIAGRQQGESGAVTSFLSPEAQKAIERSRKAIRDFDSPFEAYKRRNANPSAAAIEQIVGLELPKAQPLLTLSEPGQSVTSSMDLPAPDTERVKLKDGRPRWASRLLELRANRKMSRTQVLNQLKRLNPELRVSAGAIKKHEEGRHMPGDAARQAYASLYEMPEKSIFVG